MAGLRMKAAVAQAPGSTLELTEVVLDEPRSDEVLIKMRVTGICHTDINASQGRLPVTMPIILGHEGAGVVERVGAHVTQVSPGDTVVLVPDFCRDCSQCRQGHTAYCELADVLVFGGTRLDGSPKAHRNGEAVRAGFFGESSFAQYSLVTERNIVKVSPEAPLALLASLTCGVNAGAGGILNGLGVGPHHSVAVFGVGTVGLAAVMAAAMAGAHPIIAVDRHASRLDLARDLGATAVVNTAQSPDLDAALAAAAPRGVDRSLDSTGNPELIRAAIDILATRGVCGYVSGTGGVPLELDLTRMLAQGKQLRPLMGGEGTGTVFLHELIRYFELGRLPMERLVKTYPFEDINKAIDDMKSGDTIKPILVFE